MPSPSQFQRDSNRTAVHPDDLFGILGGDAEVRNMVKQVVIAMLNRTMADIQSGNRTTFSAIQRTMLPPLVKILAGQGEDGKLEALRTELKLIWGEMSSDGDSSDGDGGGDGGT